MIGQTAPNFSAKAVIDGGEFKDIQLNDHKGKWVTLFFYPLDFTFVCPTEITQFRDHLKDFNEAECLLFGCSVDSEYSHRKWIRDDLGDLGFPLLADITKRIARDYSVLMDDKGVAMRATFILDPEHRIQYMASHNLSVGRDVSEILRVLKALQTGELCPAAWKPGQSVLQA